MKKIFLPAFWVMTLATLVDNTCCYGQQMAPISRRMCYLDGASAITDDINELDELELAIDPADLTPCGSSDDCCTYTLELTLGIDHNFGGLVEPFNLFEVFLECTLLNGNGPSEHVLRICELCGDASIQDKAYVKIDVEGPVSVKVLDIVNADQSINQLPRNVYIDATLSRFCEINLDYSAQTDVQVNPILDEVCTDENNVHEIFVSWDPIAGAEEYHLEWTFVNDYGPESLSDFLDNGLAYDFKSNSTRISTKNYNYAIPLLFDHGYIIFRVRGLGRYYDGDQDNPSDPNYVFPGTWSIADAGTLNTETPEPYVFHVLDPHEPNLNWQCTTTFAEEGKKKEVVSYFDGSQRNRQTITRLNTQNDVVVGETIYDAQGRPAINVLPTPVSDPEDCSLSNTGYSTLHYYRAFNLSTINSDESYSFSDFDLDDAQESCGPMTTQAMSSSNGSAQYYSSSNDDLTAQQAFVPDAFGYPFTQVEYTADNTGRIKRQGGVGPQFQLGSGHETKYFYASPFQIELDRLFGSEVGNASHYQKNMVLDPNGQVSISYLDMEGRTIATCLAGESPVNLEPLQSLQSLVGVDPNNPVVQPLMTVNLIDPILAEQQAQNNTDGVMLSTKSIAVAYPTEYQFTYDLHIERLHLGCMPENHCAGCVYDLEVILQDDCGTEIFRETFTTGTMTVQTTLDGEGEPVMSFVPNSCNLSISETPGMVPIFVSDPVDLPIGTYYISKRLKINEAARETYLQAYLATSAAGCITSYEDILNEELSQINPADCYTNCEECVEALGGRDAFIAAGSGEGSDWDDLYEACMDNCDDFMDPCAAPLELMLADMSPAGQYATYSVEQVEQGGELVSQISLAAGAHALSVLKEENMLPVPNANWRNPLNIFIAQGPQGVYLDEFNERTRIYVTLNEDGVSYTPAVVVGTVITDSEGEFFVYPENLSDVKDFIDRFDPGWARSLITYHPEYCYYQSCLTFGPDEYEECDLPNDCRAECTTSTSFDHLLMSANTMNEAITKGLVDGTTYLPYNWTIMDPTRPYDPFCYNTDPDLRFKVTYSNGDDEDFGERLQHKFLNYQNDGDGNSMSMTEFVGRVTRCSLSLDGTCTYGFGSDGGLTDPETIEALRDNDWQTLKSFYLSAKRQIQKEYQDALAISTNCGGFNQCIGDNAFNPYLYSEFVNDLSNPAPPVLDGPYVDQSEPCGAFTKQLYANKTPRFMDASDFEGMDEASNLEALGYQTYLLTGQCPIDMNFEHLLNAFVTADLATADGQMLYQKTEFPGLIYALNDYNTEDQLNGWDWQWYTIAFGPQLEFMWFDANSDESVPMCVTQLDASAIMPNDLPSWSEVLGLRLVDDLNRVDDISYFTCEIGYTNSNMDIVWETISGNTTCVPLGQCTFSPVPTPNDLALSLLPVFNFANQAGTINGTSQLFNGTDPLQHPPLAPTINNTLGVSETTQVLWSFVPAQGEALPYWKLAPDGQAYPFIKLIAESSDPMLTDWSFGTTYYFNALNTGCEHYWTMQVVNGTTQTVATTFNGSAWLVDDTGEEPLSLGSCDWPIPMQCRGQEFDNLRDMEVLFQHELINSELVNYFLSSSSFVENANLSNTYSLNLNPCFTSGLASYLSNAMVPTLSKIDNARRDLIFDLDGCEVILFDIGNNNQLGFAFYDILEVIKMQVDGPPDFEGNYYDFTLIVRINGSPNLQTVRGTSCIPLKGCDSDCEESDTSVVSNPNGDLTHKSHIVDNSVDRYQDYKLAVEEFNELRNLTLGDQGYIEAQDYEKFFLSGAEHTVDEYVYFLEKFDATIDLFSDKLLVDKFANEYGNYRNPLLEYLRYLDGCYAYNESAMNNGSQATLIPINYVQFTDNDLATVSSNYLDYLKQNSFGASPPNIIQWRVDSYGAIPTDLCKQKYNQYLNAYRYFGYSQQENLTCDGYLKYYSLYTFEDFEANGLCCSEQTLEDFDVFITTFYNPNNCPDGMPVITECQALQFEKETERSCSELFQKWFEAVKSFNYSAYAVTNVCSLNHGDYDEYQKLSPSFY
jgi:hypothetical protein